MMTITFHCPYCTKELNYMELQMDKDLHYVFEALPTFGQRYSNLVMAYVYLFGVTPMAIKAKKMRIIIEEMKRLFDSQAFSYQKKTYQISHAGIGEALDLCVKKNFPEYLENHNYLKRVMMTISEREGKNQSRAAEKDIKTREQKQMAGNGRPGDDAPIHITEEQRKSNLTRVGDIIKAIGG